VARRVVEAETARAAAGPGLSTARQLAAERTVLRLMHHPAIIEAQERLRCALRAMPSAAMLGAQQRLENGIQKWTAGILLREIAADPATNAFLWIYDEVPHDWREFRFPGSGCCGGNPDQVYRHCFVDGVGRYEITGRLAQCRPVHLSLEAFFGQPGTRLDRPRTGPDTSRQVSFITDTGLRVADDGSFCIQVGGGEPEGGGNYLALADGSIEVTVREVLSDWEQRPAQLVLRRLDEPRPALPYSDDELAARAAADVVDFVRFWVGAFDRWVGPFGVNTVAGPVPRDGGWGFLANLHYRLEPGEAILLSMARQGAAYIGVHMTDPWTLVPDSRLYQTSLNPLQAAFTADSRLEVVVGPDDPGVVNWIDTVGMREGYLIPRWIGMPPGVRADELIQRFEIVDLARSGVPAGFAGGSITSDRRREQLERRAGQYGKRFDSTA